MENGRRSSELAMDSTKPELHEYQYRPLNFDAGEIRFIRLLPGNFDDDLAVEIFHAPFVEPEPAKDPRLPIREIQKTLPKYWQIRETNGGRCIYDNSEESVTKWTHPDPEADEELFGNGQSFEEYPNFEPTYEGKSGYHNFN